MIFTLYTTAEQFAAEVTETLKKHEIQNNLLFHNISDGPDKLMCAVKDDDGRILLTGIRTLPFPLVLYETDNLRNDQAAEFMAKSLLERRIPVSQIMGEPQLARSFCMQVSGLMGKGYRLKEGLTLYVLDRVTDLPKACGAFRRATQKDLFYLPYWLADFVPACHLGEYDLTAGMQTAQRLLNAEAAYVWETDTPVSMAAHNRTQGRYAIIAQVYTPPHLRGKGFSTACAAALSHKLLDDGYAYCALYADRSNPCSNRVYQKIGYQPVIDYDKYELIGGNILAEAGLD